MNDEERKPFREQAQGARKSKGTKRLMNKKRRLVGCSNTYGLIINSLSLIASSKIGSKID